MHKGTKSLVWILIVILSFNFLPISSVKAAEDISIISKTTITAESAKKWAKEKGATQTFINLADLFWKYAPKRGGVNPAVAYIQSALETGFGHFGGVIDESYHNTCGLKTTVGGSDTDVNAHKRFSTWDEGVQAQLDHLALYAGATGYPRSNTFDPRHFASIKGKAPTVLKLSNNWAGGDYGTKIMNLYNDLTKIKNNSSSYVVIETPVSNANITKNTLDIKGWSINPSGVAVVNIYVDGVKKTSTKSNISRPDVAAAYPGYSNAQISGYKATIDLTTVSNGVRTIKVESVGKNGAISNKEVKINLNKPSSIQCIDSPISNATVKGSILTVTGWALNASGVENIKVYVDNKLKATINTGLSRPDVKAVYPQYANAASGFSTDVNISDIADGNRIIKVLQTGKDKTICINEVTVNVKKLKPMTEIDSPTNGIKVTSDTIIVKGWAINANEIKSVKVYVDNKFISYATIGLSRPDVNNAYPEYSNASNSGYSMNLDLKNIADGTRTIKVEQVDKNGVTSTLTNKIIIDKPAPKIYIDTPTNGKVVSGNTLNISGWALNSSGVDKVKIYIDGILKNTTNVGVLRQDVKNVFPQYGDANSGFNVNLDITDIKAGVKTVKVEQIGKDNSKTSSEVKVNRVIVTPSPMSCIDSPTSLQTVSNKSIKVTGWALNSSGISKIKVYVDGKYKTDAKIGITRTDVAKAYPQYLNADKSGFTTGVIDLTDIAPGNRVIEVRQIGKNASVQSSYITFNNQKKISRIMLDSPALEHLEKSDTLAIRGWALDDSKVKNINVYIDNNIVKTMSPNELRKDVNAIYSGYPDGNKSGFNTSVNISSLATGSHRLKVQEVGYDGMSNSAENIFYYKSKTKLIVIDPGHNYGGDYGAESTFNGVTYSETVMNMAVALRLESTLKAQGYSVVLTRSALERSTLDLSTSLKNRALIANSLNADLFISIHHNASPSSSARGSEVYYTERTTPDDPSVVQNADKISRGKDLAIAAASSMSAKTGIINKGGKGDVSSLGYSLSVLRNTKMPAILVECGFLTNSTEASMLNNPVVQQKAVDGITSAVKARF